MKFLIDNYIEYNNSQAIYFQQHLTESGHDVVFINEQKMSMFDYFDKIKPDIYLTNIKKLSKDAVIYLSENKNIQLILSVADSKNSEILEVEQILNNYKINCSFFITNVGDADLPFTKRIKVIRIMNCVDINMPDVAPINYQISKAVITNSNTAIRNYDSTYHVLSTNQKISKDIDICLSVNAIKSLLRNYDEVIFSDIDGYIPQLFFESLSMGKKTFYDIKGVDESEKAKKIMDGVFGVGDSLDYKSLNRLEDFSELQSIVNEKHTSVKRTNTLLSQIPKVK